MKRLLLILFQLLPMVLMADNVIHDTQVKTLQATVNGDWLSMPVMQLGKDDVLSVSFDQLSHDYHNFTYWVEHCEPDWTSSQELFESDWMEGFNGNPIDDYAYSINTSVAYTHYKLQIPNERLRLKLSGNYRLHIYDEDGDAPREVATVDFWVTEESMPVTLSATTNTDIDMNQKHQQVSMAVNYGSFRVTDPLEQIQTVVMQNGRESSKRVNVKPSIIKADGLEWKHCRDLIFDGGNEYHKFEILDVSHATMGIERIVWDGTNYEAFPFVSEARPNYLYDEDADGAFYIRNSNEWECATTCEYVWVNYFLHCPPLPEGTMVIEGQWTTDIDRSTYMMTYNQSLQMYSCHILQKQGYYNYQYFWQHPDGTLTIPPSEGNYYQTENRYQAFIYFRGTGENTWRLSSYRQISLK